MERKAAATSTTLYSYEGNLNANPGVIPDTLHPYSARHPATTLPPPPSRHRLFVQKQMSRSPPPGGEDHPVRGRHPDAVYADEQALGDALRVGKGLGGPRLGFEEGARTGDRTVTYILSSPFVSCLC